MAIQATLDQLRPIMLALNEQYYELVADSVSDLLLSDDPLNWYCALCFAQLALELQGTN